MVVWLLEHQGREKPLDDVETSELRHMLEPVQTRIAAAIATIPEDKLTGLRIVFYFTPQAQLKVRLEGPAMAVNLVADELGDSTEIGHLN